MHATRKTAAARAGRANDPPILILTSLASGPKHGYALQRDIAEFAGVDLGPGALYGAIGRLEERGLIEAVADDGRARPYRLTDSGTAALAAALAELETIVAVGSQRLSARTDPPLGAAT